MHTIHQSINQRYELTQLINQKLRWATIKRFYKSFYKTPYPKEVTNNDIFDIEWTKEEIVFCVHQPKGFLLYTLIYDYSDILRTMPEVESLEGDFITPLSFGPLPSYVDRNPTYEDITIDEIEAYIIDNFKRAVIVKP